MEKLVKLCEECYKNGTETVVKEGECLICKKSLCDSHCRKIEIKIMKTQYETIRNLIITPFCNDCHELSKHISNETWQVRINLYSKWTINDIINLKSEKLSKNELSLDKSTKEKWI